MNSTPEKPAEPAAAAAEAPKPEPPVFKFGSGLPDCVKSNPESYKIVAEIPNARLVEMRVPPGGEDKPHDHPSHSMFFAKPAKLSITDYGPDGKPAGEPHTVEIPMGAAPIFPAGAHQVKNIGDTEAIVLMVEQYPLCMPCGEIAGYISPFKVAPTCYKVLAENDDWITGVMEMQPGEQDGLHHHKDHLIYVLEGDEITIYPDGNLDDPHAVPIKPEAGIPAPMAAGPIFSKHLLKNTGTKTCKMLFFEMKK